MLEKVLRLDETHCCCCCLLGQYRAEEERQTARGFRTKLHDVDEDENGPDAARAPDTEDRDQDWQPHAVSRELDQQVQELQPELPLHQL